MGKPHHVLLSVTLFLLVCISALCHRRSFDNSMPKNSAATERRNGLPTAESLIEESTETNMKLEHGDKVAATHGDRSSLKKTGASSKAGASSQQSTSKSGRRPQVGRRQAQVGRRLAKVVARPVPVVPRSPVQRLRPKLVPKVQVGFQWRQVQVGFKRQPSGSSGGKSKSGSSFSKSGFSSGTKSGSKNPSPVKAFLAGQQKQTCNILHETMGAQKDAMVKTVLATARAMMRFSL